MHSILFPVLLSVALQTTSPSPPQAPPLHQAPRFSTQIISDTPESSRLDSVIDYALALQGMKYGAKQQNYRLDCSGVVRYTFHQVGLKAIGGSRNMARSWPSIANDQIQKGDLMFFQSPNRRSNRIGHVALVAKADSSGIWVVHATRRGIVYENILQQSYYRRRYIKAVRPRY